MVSNKVDPEEAAKEDKNLLDMGLTLSLLAGAKPNAIPVEFADMRERLIKEFPDFFAKDAFGIEKYSPRTFRRLADRIWLANRQRLNRLFHKWSESYMYFNPDHGGVVHPKDEISNSQLDYIQQKWRSVLKTVLDKAGYARVDPSVMDDAVSNRALGGIQLIPPDMDAIEYQIFYRGTDSEEKTVRNMYTWFKKTTVHYTRYERLVVLYRIKKKPDEYKEEMGCCGWKWPLLVKLRNMFALGGESVTPIIDSDPELVYMKLFKDVRSLDIDMMIPGSSLNFTWLDVALIWIPTLIGIYCSIKSIYDIWGTQETVLDWLVLVVLLILPFSWAQKTYAAIKNKENQYMVELGNMYMTQNLNNNSGVCGDLMEEAHEQENNETLLAYFFLWMGGGQAFKGKHVLDRDVEAYLSNIMADYDQDPNIDFDVSDAVDKLVQMGLCTRKDCPDGSSMYKVSDLEQATELINPVRVSAFLNSLASHQGRGPCAMSDWHEAFAVDPATGKLVRFFSNPRTGQQTREVPESYVPENFNASAVGPQTLPAVFADEGPLSAGIRSRELPKLPGMC